MNKNLSQKTIFLIIFISVLASLFAYQYKIVFYYLLALIPLFILQNKSTLITKLLTTAFLWFIVNLGILSTTTSIINPQKLSMEIVLINTLILSWVNFAIYMFFFYNIYQEISWVKDKLQNKSFTFYIILVTIISCFLTTLSLYKYIYSPIWVAVASIIFALIYTYLLNKIFSKKQIIFINFSLSLSPIITIISAWIILFIILNTLYIPEAKRPCMMIGFTFLVYLQILSISSLLTLITPKKAHQKNSYNILIYFFLFLLISIGIIIQRIYLPFLYY